MRELLNTFNTDYEALLLHNENLRLGATTSPSCLDALAPASWCRTAQRVELLSCTSAREPLRRTALDSDSMQRGVAKHLHQRRYQNGWEIAVLP
ncbi:unnamed protein product [Parnassius apollo]|uniref:(apollo) hypothetical protein n=1 Tax=Parnassius apollo TaxID=110799 RepID=A0A8S3XD87_PARAO|nr:unnamed protein product [Parnassius apollo]